MTPISICIIAKNEEKHMEVFLSSIKKYMGAYPYEIVLVDTGSTDATIEIARRFTDNIFHFDWINDFSAARNFSISCAQNNWILVLDCDEYLTSIDTNALELMINQYSQHVGMITRRNHYLLNGSDSVHTDLVERFFNKKLYHYEAIIHEQVRPINKDLQMRRVNLPITVEHSGYIGTPEELKTKAERNIELLLKMLSNTPEDPYLHFQLGQSYNMMQDKEKACFHYAIGLEHATNPALEYVQMMVLGCGYALIDLGRNKEALLLENVYEDFCQTADFVCMMGIIYLRNGLLEQAVDEFFKATTMEISHVEGANSFIPTYNLGCINEVLGNTEDAIALYKECGDFPIARERLKLLLS